MFEEFKKFAMRGNVMDMAVGIIIGGTFGKIVSSFVGDILTPPVGMVLGEVDFTNLFINLGEGEYATLEAAKEAGVPTINYGNFMGKVLDFVIVGLAIFMMATWINNLKKKEVEAPKPPPGPTINQELITEIRDLLQK